MFPYIVLNFLLDLPTLLTVIKNFRLHLPNTKKIRYQNLQLLKVLRTFVKTVGILFRESLQNLFLATLPCVVKINSTKSASNESIAKSWEVLNRNYKLHQSYVWIFKKICIEFNFGFIVQWRKLVSLKVWTVFHVVIFVPRSSNVRYDTFHFLSCLVIVDNLKKNPVTIRWETNKVTDNLKIPFFDVPLGKQRYYCHQGGRYAKKI